MSTSEHQMDALVEERAAIVRSGRLHWFHWAVVLLSLGLTIAAWQFAKRQVDEHAAEQFERGSEQVVALVDERMRRYELGLWAGVSAIQAIGGDIDRASWRVFANSLNIDAEYPGISGIGVIHHVPPENLEDYLANQRRLMPDYGIHPGHEEPVYLPITYVEPADKNAAAIGLDMAHEGNRFGAALQARDTGEAQITSPIVLVQDAGKTPGFLFYAPFYDGGPADSEEQRRARFTGMVYAPFIFSKLMEGVLDKEKRQVRIRVSDSTSVLYDELAQDDPEIDGSPTFSTTRELDLYGKTWIFDIDTTRAFAAANADQQPTAVLMGGLLIEGLLLALFVMLTRANRRAVDFADRMTAALMDRSKELEKSNAELEKFAYVTSHDLKTPLRGISDLTTYLEEDLEPYLNRDDACPDVPTNLMRLRQQTRRMDGLIRGILDYSSIGSVPPEAGHIASSDVLQALRDDHGLTDDQVPMIGDLPIVTTDVIRFQQVMANLVGNAIKYHDRPERMTVTVTARETSDFYVFSITDDGPGIEPRFHERIFDVFQTLRTKDDVESTGIGLSIVKKAVESHGGQITVASEPGMGTTFTFDWPKGAPSQQKKAA